MQVLSHRGYWAAPAEKNDWPAFERTLGLRFGTETDVRDHAGELVISHDPATAGAIRLSALLDLFAERGGSDLPLGINVKADGLARSLALAFAGRDLNWFVFDMSFPDLREQLRAGNPVFARMSEHEALPEHLADQLSGIWLDAFDSDWFGPDEVMRLLNRGLKVCIVSPELHRRDHHAQWEQLLPLTGVHGVMICTDLPEQARDFFKVDRQR